ncbi:MAG TPA: hypothetical protein PLI09_04345 [Candidatus Hydrogenedentes bacterium]|nr:hypothetical protein [Candidatus Hydrogenedentota bacterium]
MSDQHRALFRICLVASVLTGMIGMKTAGWADPPIEVRIATFDIDVTPPIGSFLAYDPVIGQGELGLRARGVVLMGADKPIVLCALDWLGIGSGGYDAFREALAEAAGTDVNRVAVHTLHQHDAPGCDFTAEQILKDQGIAPHRYEGTFQREVIQRLSKAAHEALDHAQPVTHLGLGSAPVKEVASNRRIVGPDGKVGKARYTACKDPVLKAAPEGVIDPLVSLISFWNGESPVAVLSYYATHPQSYYRTGIANPDFPGIARFFRQLAVPDALHIHFNGAGGNVGAGKYNDGAHENRLVLAERLADGMRRAWEATERFPLTTSDVHWSVLPVALPPGAHLNEEELIARMRAEKDMTIIEDCARKVGWLRRCKAGIPINVSCLTLGRARILHLPGELFVEYQLNAKAARPDLFIAMAAYGDYTPGYIGTTVAYEQGGYEASPRSSNVAPEVEGVLMDAIRKLLDVKEAVKKP